MSPSLSPQTEREPLVNCRVASMAGVIVRHQPLGADAGAPAWRLVLRLSENSVILRRSSSGAIHVIGAQKRRREHPEANRLRRRA